MQRISVRRHYPALALVVVVFGSSLLQWHTDVALEFDRFAILSHAEYYRLFSAHFVHLNWNHTLLNVSGILVGWWAFGHELSVSQWTSAIFISAFVVSSGLLLATDVEWYYGFSGLLHGLLVLALISTKRLSFQAKILCLSALTAKLILEAATDSTSMTETLIENKVVVEAHLFGVAAGVVIWLISYKLRKLGQSGCNN